MPHNLDDIAHALRIASIDAKAASEHFAAAALALRDRRSTTGTDAWQRGLDAMERVVDCLPQNPAAKLASA